MSYQKRAEKKGYKCPTLHALQFTENVQKLHTCFKTMVKAINLPFNGDSLFIQVSYIIIKHVMYFDKIVKCFSSSSFIPVTQSGNSYINNRSRYFNKNYYKL